MENTKNLGTGGISNEQESDASDSPNYNGLRLRIFAGNVANIMTRTGKWKSSPLKNVSVSVNVVDDSTVWINGKLCGNRHGAALEFARIVHEFAMENQTPIHSDND